MSDQTASPKRHRNSQSVTASKPLTSTCDTCDTCDGFPGVYASDPTQSPKVVESDGAGLKLAYSVDDVAAMLSIGRTKAVYLISSGEIPSVKLGGRRLILRAELDQFVESLRNTPIDRAS